MDVTLKQYLTTFAYNDDFADICYRNRPQEVNELMGFSPNGFSKNSKASPLLKLKQNYESLDPLHYLHHLLVQVLSL